MKNKIRFWLSSLFSPVMKPGYRRADGTYLPNTRISNTTFIDYPENFFVEDNVFIGHHNFIEASNEIKIAEGCQITNFITITTHSSHVAIRLYGREYGNVDDMKGYVKGKVEIGKFTFVGPHSVLMPETKIGKGSIVSAFSYVQGAFPDFSIIAGNPAVVVGDTRNLDKKYLEANPELKSMYEQWATD